MLQQDVTFHDDSFNFDPNSLQQRSERGADGPLPTPGYYKVRVVSGGTKTNKDTKELLTDKKGNPIFYINRIALLDGGDTPLPSGGDSYGVFKDIYTNGFQPKNWKTGETIPGPMRYEFCEALASIDVNEVTADFNENVHQLGKLLAANPVMIVKLGYTGTDMTYAKAQIAAGKQKNEAYKAATLAPGSFRNPDGSWRTEAQGPSGDMVTAKLRITGFEPSTSNITLGALKMRGSK